MAVAGPAASRLEMAQSVESAAPGYPAMVWEPRWVAEIETRAEVTATGPCDSYFYLTRSRIWRSGT